VLEEDSEEVDGYFGMSRGFFEMGGDIKLKMISIVNSRTLDFL
jgi:hypothetical protein